MDLDKDLSRREFADRLGARNFDVEDYAHEEDAARANVPADETKLFESSRAVENQVMATLELREKLGEDALTGAKNLRRYREETERLQRTATFNRDPEGPHRKNDIMSENPFAVIALDIDHFKNINDTYGHPAGDEVLRELVSRINRRVRKGDMLARCGGEEFRIVALSVNGSAPRLAEEIRRLISDELFTVHDNNGGEHRIHVTISVGVSPYNESTGNMESRSDAALYEAKGNHRDAPRQRNQVWVWDTALGNPVKYVARKRVLPLHGSAAGHSDAAPAN